MSYVLYQVDNSGYVPATGDIEGLVNPEIYIYIYVYFYIFAHTKVECLCLSTFNLHRTNDSNDVRIRIVDVHYKLNIEIE